jgi:PAS domain-containing protein
MPPTQATGLDKEPPFWGEGPADSPAHFFQQMPLPVGVLRGAALVYQQVNPAYQQLFPGRKLVGQPWAEAMPELASHPITHRLQQVYKTGIPLAESEPVLVPAPPSAPAETRYVRFSAQARHNAAGQLDGVLLFAHETSTPTAEAQELAQARTQIAEGIAQIPALVALLYGPEHQIAFANPAFQQQFPDRQLEGLPYAQALPEAYAQGYGAWLNQVYSTGETLVAYDTPLHFRNTHGEEQQAYYDFAYSAYGEQATQGLMILAFNATERVVARQERAARQQQLLAIFEQAPAALALLHGPEYVVEMANPSICAMWGRELAQVAGRPLFEALPEIVGHGFEELFAGVRQTGHPFVAQERAVELLRAGRYETVYFNFVYQPLFDVQGQVDSIAIVATEVSTQVLARQRVEELTQELATLNEQLQTNSRALNDSNTQTAICN